MGHMWERRGAYRRPRGGPRLSWTVPGLVQGAPRLSSFTPENLHQAEMRANRIVSLVQPTVKSDAKRKQVIAYVQKLIGASIGNEVVAFGSVPLKTFLPDGDVDLTALSDSVVADTTLAEDIRRILESEENNSDAELQVKDVRIIEAEVRLVKCLIENFIVDVSFNQIGGLYTLCFLELVDDYIGKDHLFKRSIILVKSWCYYESRILGAHHGLLSTYALETLVLYILNHFHGSLSGPISVLYKFLEYFSTFDWDRYCISLYGPVRISSLPNLDVEVINLGSGELKFTPEKVANMLNSLCFPPQDKSSKEFTTKHLNVIDPLKKNNNLGRSVSRSSYYRIKSAFSYGARKLGHILGGSVVSVPGNITLFFTNTLQRNNIAKLPKTETLTNRDIPQLMNTSTENVSATDGSELASGVLDLSADLEVHMTSLRRLHMHNRDIFIQLQDQTPVTSSLDVSTEDIQRNPVCESVNLTRWETNGSVSDPSPRTSSSPISGSCSTTEDQSQNQYLHNNFMWDSQSMQQQAYMSMNMSNGSVIPEMVQGISQGMVGSQYSYEQYANAGMHNSNWEIPHHQSSMQYNFEELMWNQAQEWEMSYPVGSYSPYQSGGTGMYMNAGVNRLPFSPWVGVNEVNVQRGTGTYLPSMVIENGTNTQRDRRGGNGKFRKQATAYHLQRQHRDGSSSSNSNGYRATNGKSSEKNLPRRGNQFGNPSLSKPDSIAAFNRRLSKQVPPVVGANPQVVPVLPSAASTQFEKILEFGSLGPVVLEGNSSQECTKGESTVTDKKEKAQDSVESFKWSRKASSISPSEASSYVSTCQEIVKVPGEAFPWSMKETLKAPSESSSNTSASNQENINLPLMETPLRCNKGNVKVLSDASPSTCKENVKGNTKAWSHTHQGDCKPLPDLYPRSWAEVSKRGALPYYLKDEGDFPPLSS